MIHVVRYALAAAAFFVAVTVSIGSARAATEYCGAGVDRFAIPPKTFADISDVYAFSITAKSARTVSGTVMAHAGDGWYSFDVRNVKVEPRANRYRTPNVQFTRTDFASDYIYVRFPSPQKLISAYVARASVDDPADQTAGATRDCYPYDTFPPTVASKIASPYKVEAVTKQPEPAMTAATPVLVAKAAAAPDGTNCADPFAAAVVTKPVTPAWPFGYTISAPLMELVRVSVGPQGELDDASVYVPTGSDVFDEAGLDAARASKYKAARAFCKDVPGDYLFRVIFNPD